MLNRFSRVLPKAGLCRPGEDRTDGEAKVEPWAQRGLRAFPGVGTCATELVMAVGSHLACGESSETDWKDKVPEECQALLEWCLWSLGAQSVGPVDLSGQASLH